MAVGPLDGIRVVEVASWLAAPGATALMADMGADVIKVEPPQGDYYRGYMLDRRGPDGVNVNFELDNRGKRSITVDLERDGASEVIYRLCSRADIFVTNLILARLERYGLHFEAIQQANARIVYAALSGYGYRGPKANRPGFDGGAFWAESGIMALLGEEGTPLVGSRGGQGDHPTSLNLLAATLAALRLRDITGEGQFVDVALQRTGMWTIATDLQAALNLGTGQPPRANRAYRGMVTWAPYQTADGRWIMLMMNQPERYWNRFARALARPEWIDDRRYTTVSALLQDGAELLPEIEAIFRDRSFAEWVDRLDAEGCLWASVALLEEVINDTQLL
ncbi:MAG: CaiB/BaiF CoA transferase family protein, partial [Dehalococcoidia bacterium]